MLEHSCHLRGRGEHLLHLQVQSFGRKSDFGFGVVNDDGRGHVAINRDGQAGVLRQHA
jgi:hypothetical protein